MSPDGLSLHERLREIRPVERHSLPDALFFEPRSLLDTQPGADPHYLRYIAPKIDVATEGEA